MAADERYDFIACTVRRFGYRGLKRTGASYWDGNDQRAASPTENPWSRLLQRGTALLQHLAAAANHKRQSFIHRDASTGDSYLRILMPTPEVLDQALRTLSTLLDSLRR